MAFIPQNILVPVKEVNSGGTEQEIRKKVTMVSIAICKFGGPAERALCKKGSEGRQHVCGSGEAMSPKHRE